MNEYVEKMVSTAKEVAGVIADKTMQTVDLGKTEYEIKKVERDIERAYRALGRLTYQIEEGVLNRDDHIIKAACAQIAKAQQKLEDLKAEKENIKNRDIKADEGEKEKVKSQILKPQKDRDGYVVLKFCPACKIGNHPDAGVCVNCGHEF